MDVQRCTGCGVVKPYGEFWANCAKASGRQNECKDCIRARDAKKRRSAMGLPDLRRKFPPAAVSENGDATCVTCGTTFRFNHGSPKRHCAPCLYKRRRAKAPEAWRGYSAAYRKANKAKISESLKLARVANPAKFAGHRNKRKRAVAERADGTLTSSVVQGLFSRAKRCVYCSCKMAPSDKTIDHLVPIALGGGHTAANVVVCCVSCNCSKGSAPFSLWVERLRERHGETAARRAGLAFRRATNAHPQQAPLPFTFGSSVRHEHRGASS